MILAVFCAAATTAMPSLGHAASVTVVIDGLEGPARTNIETVLGIVREQGDTALAPHQIRLLHTRAPGEIELAMQPFGFYRPRIESSLESTPDEQSFTARYIIQPGDPIRIDSLDLELQGDGRTDPEIVDLFEAFPLESGDVLLHAPYEAAKAAMAIAMADNGYFDAVVDSTAIVIDLEAYVADVVVHIDTGPRYRFGEVALEQDVLDPRVLEGHIDFEPGDPYEVERLLHLQVALSEGPYFGRVAARPRRDLAEGLQIPIEVELTPRKTQRFEVGAGYGTDTVPSEPASAD